MFALALVFLLGAAIAIAKESGGGKDFSGPLKVEKSKVRHFEKKRISDSDRERGDALEQMIIKGTKPVKPAPPVVDPTAGGVTGVLGAPLPEGGKKYAIVVGLANYPGVSTTTTDALLPDLCVMQVPESDLSAYAPDENGDFASLEDEIKYNCKDGDSVNMKKTLKEKYGFAEENIYLFSDSEATFDNIKQKVDLLMGTEGTPGLLKAEDELVFLFSGHGALSDDDTVDGDIDEKVDGGIVVYDGNYKPELYTDLTLKYTDPATQIEYANYKTYYDTVGYDPNAYIWDGQLRAWFKDPPTKRMFFAFDTCNAEEMDDLEEEEVPTTDGIGRVLAFSSGRYESSYTYYLGGANNSGNIHDSEGLFSHYFVLRAMYDGLADGSNPLRKTSVNPLKKDGKVAVEEAFSYAYPLVRAASSYRQTPVLEDAFTNDLLLDYQLP